MSPLLEVRGVSVSYGGVRAVVDVDLDVHQGEVVGLIGPNGAGKTTFVDALTGFVRCTGRVTLDGRDLAGLSPHRRAGHGLARTWQTIELFSDLTVRENLAVAAHRTSAWTAIGEIVRRPAAGGAALHDALALLDLEALADAMPDELSQGERMLVGVARALTAEPRVICLDEPAAGLDTRESAELGRCLRQVVDAGTAILLIDHDMGLVLGVSDRVVVLEFGEVIAAGAPDEVRRDPRVVAAYLGGDGAQELEAAR